jgi:hypothetical protein
MKDISKLINSTNYCKEKMPNTFGFGACIEMIGDPIDTLDTILKLAVKGFNVFST